jgi:hypothetical protein
MGRLGERTADGYRVEGARVRLEAEGVLQPLLRAQLMAVAMEYDALARIATTLDRVRKS